MVLYYSAHRRIIIKYVDVGVIFKELQFLLI